jgi:hypothetical protein
MSPLSLIGEAISSLSEEPLLACESTDVRLAAELGRDAGRDAGRGGPAKDMRLVVVLGATDAARAVPDEVDACLVRAVGGGGPMDVRGPPIDGRDFAPTEGARAFDGVPVRDTVVLEAALNCFVGDFVGDLIRVSIQLNSCTTAPTLAMLVGRDTLGTGLGLGALRLFLLPKPASPAALEALPEVGAKLLGLAAGFRAAGFGVGACAIILAITGLTNMP